MEPCGIYGATKRGNKSLIYNGFEFWHHKSLKNGSVVWRCCKHQSFKCKAKVVAKELLIVGSKNPEHSHGGNNSTALARRAVGEMKLRLVDTLANPSVVQASVASNLPDNTLMALPKKATLSRALRLHRQQAGKSGEASMPPVPLDCNFIIPPRFADFVMFDSGPSEDRMIIFGCHELLDGLARAPIWLADGTFKVVPSLFFQLYTLHFQFVNGINPAALYCLLKNKTRATYDRLIDEVLRLIPASAPTLILTDFEIAAMSAFREKIPTARVTGCYFHLAQSVLRKVNEVGLKVDYETRDEVRCAIRCLAALSHVPVEDVCEAFDLLVESMPTVDHLDEVVTYFEHTYIRGRRLRGRGDNYGQPLFSIESWNQTESAAHGIARTNNICEGWHHALQSLLQCNHPTMWTFIVGLQNDCSKQKASFLQGVTGVEQTGQKKYRDLRERVKRAVGTYGQTEVLIYLRAIAHLSYA